MVKFLIQNDFGIHKLKLLETIRMLNRNMKSQCILLSMLLVLNFSREGVTQIPDSLEGKLIC